MTTDPNIEVAIPTIRIEKWGEDPIRERCRFLEGCTNWFNFHVWLMHMHIKFGSLSIPKSTVETFEHTYMY